MWGVMCRPLGSQRSWDIITDDPLYSCFCVLGFNHGVVLHIFTEKKNPHVSEPVHFKPMLFQGQVHVFEPPQKSNRISNLLFGWTKKQIVVGTTSDFTLIFMSWAVSQSRFAMVIKAPSRTTDIPAAVTVTSATSRQRQSSRGEAEAAGGLVRNLESHAGTGGKLTEGERKDTYPRSQHFFSDSPTRFMLRGRDVLGAVRLFASPWTIAHEAPLSMGCSS